MEEYYVMWYYVIGVLMFFFLLNKTTVNWLTVNNGQWDDAAAIDVY